MLNELETLSQNIGRLIAINERQQQARHALEEQLAQLRAENDTARAELALLRDERNALQVERDTLLAKIDDAQVRLNAILEKLPRGKGAYDADNQLDLLAPSGENAAAPNGAAAQHGENA
ncbi:ATPase [Trinickia caryophylli]|uniref:ATPase n=1 Tax=Trinickia caryophylli TaxID=28094 RepID=A0A1X7GXT2_TRICW|nr:ATPase [Trinickia caryophylli]PMS10160.1 ATPase [Trinickia caryophylli]TRX18261.1 ATPase [Trinickia caryophylli]WQE10953.1 ATPase [Trinickia caryophylli]SMF76217.1 hypothetical protein SAMN06295900_11916 [Trinickia caryophylli]GLU35441.1 hypothetical protein Busp01_52830 [Trinickia caryophylli]